MHLIAIVVGFCLHSRSQNGEEMIIDVYKCEKHKEILDEL
jgi:hypothetical protein